MSFKSTGLVFAEKPSIGIELATLPDRSRFGNHGTHTDITMVRLPSGLWVRSFNGSSSKIALGTGRSLNFTSEDFTILLWLYQDSINNYFVLDNESYHNYGYAFILDAGNTCRIRTHTSGAHIDTASTASLSATTWEFLAVTRSGANALIYLNAVDIVDSAGTHIDPVISQLELIMGVRPSDGYGDYAGDVGLPRIYNRALSAGQIKKIFEAERHWFGV